MDTRTSDLFQEFSAQLIAGLNALPDKPEETPDGTLRALWHLAAGTPLSIQTACEATLPTLDEEAMIRLTNLITRRMAGVPLAHLTGRQRFMGLELLAGKEALIPRKETELLGRAALDALQGLAQHRDEVTVVDVCTGSGNLALGLAYFEPKARVFASDLSGEAVVLARRNVQHLGLSDRVEVREGDLLAPFDEPVFHGNVDLLVCNPPYISSKKVDTMPNEIIEFEPRLAFDGGPLGIKILQRLIREAPRFLHKGGSLAFEVGLGQGPAIIQRLNHARSFTEIRPIVDDTGEVRAIVARI